jgi:hypothetical protein
MSNENTIGTTFTRETTNQNIKEEPNFTMMDPKAEKMASKTAPANAYITNVSQSDVDKNGGK